MLQFINIDLCLRGRLVFLIGARVRVRALIDMTGAFIGIIRFLVMRTLVTWLVKGSGSLMMVPVALTLMIGLPMWILLFGVICYWMTLVLASFLLMLGS